MPRLFAVLVLLLAACSGGSSEAAPSEPPEQVLEDLFVAVGRGQYGRAYERVHPAQKDLVSAAAYEECMRSSSPTFTVSDFTVVDTYEEPVTIPGTEQEASSLAVTFEAQIDGEPYTTTNHLIDEDGTWYVYLMREVLERCTA